VDDVGTMAESDTLEHLIHVEAQTFWIDSNGVLFQHFQQILFNVLEHQVQAPFPLERLLQRHNVLVFEHAEHPDFSHDGLLGDLIFIRLLKLLDGD